MKFLHAIQNNTTRGDSPYPHWIIREPLTQAIMEEVKGTMISKAERAYDGTRAADNGGGGLDGKMRCYVGDDNVHEFPATGTLIDELMSPACMEAIGDLIGRDLSGQYLRLEIVADRKGFWLKPHVDIKEKLLSMLLYVNPYNESEDLGTDLFDSKMNRVATVPYRNNLGYMFAPAHNTWHGLEKKEIKQERRSIMINYVTFPTCWKLPILGRRRAAA